jgi:hypothetical protein
MHLAMDTIPEVMVIILVLAWMRTRGAPRIPPRWREHVIGRLVEVAAVAHTVWLSATMVVLFTAGFIFCLLAFGLQVAGQAETASGSAALAFLLSAGCLGRFALDFAVDMRHAVHRIPVVIRAVRE